MIKSRKIMLVLLILVIVISITCSGYANEEKITIRLGHHHNVGAIEDQICQKFKALVEEASNGKLVIQIFPGAQLGQQVEAAQGILMGTLQMTLVCPGEYKDDVAGMGIDSLPFIFKDMDEQRKIINSAVGKKLEGGLIEKGVRILGWHGFGTRQLIFVEKDIKTFDELKGLKMRSPESDVFIEMFRRMGTIPTPVTWGEAYTAMQTGLVDGMDTSLNAIRDMNFYEVTNYCLMTNHMLGFINLLINEKLYQSLPVDLQEIILDAGKKAVDYGEQLVYEGEKSVVSWLEEKGMIFNVLSDEDVEKFRQAVISMQDEWAEQHGCIDLLNEIRSLQQ